MIFYRPVGTKELELIKESNYRRFPPRLAEQVGGVHHKELWVPAEKSDEFNEHIVGEIHIISEFSE